MERAYRSTDADEALEQALATLMAHRRRLAYRMRQRERLGDYAPPDVVLDIEDVQTAIRDLKAQLRAAGLIVPDDPIDDSRIATTPLRFLSTPDLRNRERMLQKVRDFWVRGVLDKSLYREALIALGMETRPEAVTDRWGMLVRTAAHEPRQLPPGTRIADVYDELGGELLILGAPGAGKTTVLLELARELLDRTAREPGHPIPVVFNLSSWAARRLPLAQWLLGFSDVVVWLYGLSDALVAGLFGGAGTLLADQQPRVRFVVRTLAGLALGFVVIGLLVGAIASLRIGVVAGFFASVPTGVAAVLFGMPSLIPRRLLLVETLRWSWSA